MGKVQRLNVCGLEGLGNPNDGLRYSLVPLETVPASSITGCNDIKRKCLIELVYRGEIGFSLCSMATYCKSLLFKGNTFKLRERLLKMI